MKSLSTCVIILIVITLGYTQDTFDSSVEQGLSNIQAKIFNPVEQPAYEIKKDRNEFFTTNFVIKHEDKVEIRVEYFDCKKDSLAISNPNIKNGIRLGQLIDNIDESQISLHRLGTEDLEIFGADWATQATFQPKSAFSDHRYCQLITLYKEETGLIFLYLLFNDMEKYKDEWRYLIGFTDDEEVPGELDLH